MKIISKFHSCVIVYYHFSATEKNQIKLKMYFSIVRRACDYANNDIMFINKNNSYLNKKKNKKNTMNRIPFFYFFFLPFICLYIIVHNLFEILTLIQYYWAKKKHILSLFLFPFFFPFYFLFVIDILYRQCIQIK